MIVSNSARVVRSRYGEALGLIAGLTLAAALYWLAIHGPGGFDEGVYLESLKALDHGEALGSDVFASQPPGLYLLLKLAELAPGNGLEAMRAAFLLVAIAGFAGAYFIGRALGGPLSGFTTLAVLVTAPPYPVYTPRISADVPATSLSLVAIALVLSASGQRERPLRAGLGGAVFALAVSIKLFAITAAVPLIAFALTRRLARRSLLALGTGIAAITTAFLLVYRHVLGELWDEVVAFHVDGREVGGGLRSNLDLLRGFLEFRTPFAWLVVAALVLAPLLRLRGVRVGSAPLWLWAGASAVFLLEHRPLLHHHLVLLAASLAPAVGVTLASAARELPAVGAKPVTVLAVAWLWAAACAIAVGNGPHLGHRRTVVLVILLSVVGVGLLAVSWRRLATIGTRAAVVVLSLFMLVGVAQEAHRLRGDTADSDMPAPQIAAAAATMRGASRPDDLVFTDQPIIAYQAGRRMPGRLVDTSSLRAVTGSLTVQEVIDAIDSSRIRVVALGRVFRVPLLERHLETSFVRGPTVGPMQFYFERP